MPIPADLLGLFRRSDARTWLSERSVADGVAIVSMHAVGAAGDERSRAGLRRTRTKVTKDTRNRNLCDLGGLGVRSKRQRVYKSRRIV